MSNLAIGVMAVVMIVSGLSPEVARLERET
jgi:hypothetical protein